MPFSWEMPARKTQISAARELVAAGLSPIPVRTDGSKAATVPWKAYQERPMTDDEILCLFKGDVGIALVCGPVSGNLELIDVDDNDIYEEWAARVNQLAPVLLSRLPEIRTPRGGGHIPYRCSVIESNQKLAEEAVPDAETGEIKRKTLIETRGIGGYFLTEYSPGTCHPTGKTYKHISGPPLTEIPEITTEERQLLLDIARSFNQVPKKVQALPVEKPTKSGNSHRPGDDYNKRASWEEVLVPHGWVPVEQSRGALHWRRPGKDDKGTSATTGYCGDLFYVFSSNAHPFETSAGYDKFAAYTLLNHAGDYKAAAKELSEKGYGDHHAQQPSEWRETKPLQRSLTPSNPFPVEALGTLLGNATTKLSEVVQAPVAICGQSVLAAAALAIQAHANINIDGRISPVSEFFMTIGESGERKSAVDNRALWAHRDHQKYLKTEHDTAFIQYQKDLDIYTKARNNALGGRGKTIDEMRAALDALGDSPRPPIEPYILIEEPTLEGFVKLLANGQPSVGLFSDEAGRFIGGHAMNIDNILKTAAGFSNFWDGKAISRVRAGDGNSLLSGRRVSCHWMAQPNVSQLMLSNATLLEQGFLSRVLPACPDSTAGTRIYVEVDLSQSSEMKRYWARMHEIFETPLPLAEGKQNELDPRSLQLSAEAKHLWIEFHNQIEVKLANDGPFAPIKGLANKAPEHAARLASILALTDDLKCAYIGLTYMKSGVSLMEYYLSEALRLFNAGAIDPDLALADRLLQWLRKRNDRVISLVEIYQCGPNAIHDAKTARKLIGILVEHGWARPIEGGVDFRGTRRKDAWEVKL
ncbi:MAG: hypothetical protein COV45_06045 [Deltaproteobacteria bacterium CG11_big_fil_rev_8_21_14_0_20_47_16]|nr:MAG: hypothetical protein COV45_06045 [Deltaproteobacteria bacterium CG11_big_fil_rev_8_21_14_0_20_47_16]